MYSADGIDWAAFSAALEMLGGDPTALPKANICIPEPQSPPFKPLSDCEWMAIERHISDAVRLMRPREAARSFIENLLKCEHARLSTRYLPDEQESTRQRALRWSLDGRLEKLSADLHIVEELDAERLAAFEALAEKARATRERILGARGVRITAQLDEQTAS